MPAGRSESKKETGLTPCVGDKPVLSLDLSTNLDLSAMLCRKLRTEDFALPFKRGPDPKRLLYAHLLPRKLYPLSSSSLGIARAFDVR